jgi:hypothetical protein
MPSAARIMYWWIMLSVPIIAQGANMSANMSMPVVCPNMNAVTSETYITVPGISIPDDMTVKDSTGTIGELKLQFGWDIKYELSNSHGLIGSIEGSSSFGWSGSQANLHMFDCVKTKIADVKHKGKNLWQYLTHINNRWYEVFDAQGSKVLEIDHHVSDNGEHNTVSDQHFKVKIPGGGDVLEINVERKNWFHAMFIMGASQFDKATFIFFAANTTVPPLANDPVFLILLGSMAMKPTYGPGGIILLYVLLIGCCCCCCSRLCRKSPKKSLAQQDEEKGSAAETEPLRDNEVSPAVASKENEASATVTKSSSKGIFNCCSRGGPPPGGNMVR